MQFFYAVQSTDTLYQIAKRWELPVESVVAANNLVEPYTIFIGQQLSIPPGVDLYRVQSGDTVDGISQLYGVPSSVIIEANHFEAPYILQADQLLNIPPGVPYYIVQPGDTLYEIAERFNVTMGDQVDIGLIQQVNGLSTEALSPGMQLVIPYPSLNEQGMIAYTTNLEGQYDIWLYYLNNGDNIQLTNQLGDFFSKPIWSPDNSKIAFVGKDRILYVVTIRSGSVIGIDQLDEGRDFGVNWSPNSERLAYAKQDHIILYNVMSHETESIRQPGGSDVGWFPNGTELLFQAQDTAGISQLFRMQTNGVSKQQLTRNTDGPLHNAQLSPDGTFVLYTTPGASVSIIYSMELLTGEVFEIQGGPLGKNYFPEWAPNSLGIAYNATAFDNRRYFSQIRTVGRQGENDRVWAISNCFETPVTWSPDGRSLAYLSGCKEQQFANEMWGIDLSHPVPIQLIEGVNLMSLQWSPLPSSAAHKVTYTSPAFDISLEYPSNWKKVNDERFEGDDGFFQVSALYGSQNIEEVCHAIAFQQSMPFGSTPRIIRAQNLTEQACTILPSADQPAEMNGLAVFIVKYPAPIEIEGVTYNYFVLWADQEHINEISSTIMFLP